MADPVTLMLIAGATQAVGAISSGNAQAAQYETLRLRDRLRRLDIGAEELTWEDPR